ncbi:hypothetical protein R9X47_13645 [Wukongibacter baidiensis]|uniref:hypothetical protein n=1 Tax=Wukongibacter baidiensis TaxID=1723361 RepID=UPI003D7F9F27
MKRRGKRKSNLENFFKEMAYELAGEIGAVDNEEMQNNKNLTTGQGSSHGRHNRNRFGNKRV